MFHKWVCYLLIDVISLTDLRWDVECETALGAQLHKLSTSHIVLERGDAKISRLNKDVGQSSFVATKFTQLNVALH